MLETILQFVVGRVLSHVTARRVAFGLAVVLMSWGIANDSASRVVGEFVGRFSAQHERATMCIIIIVAAIVALFLYLELKAYFCSWRRRLVFDEMTGCYIDRRDGRHVCPNRKCWKDDVPPHTFILGDGRLQCPNCGRRYPKTVRVSVGK